MAEYIDRAEYCEKYCRCSNEYCDKESCPIWKAPATDVAPVVHGRWVKHTRIHGFAYCSACKDVYLDEEWLRDGKWGYCPNCGAKMNIKEQDDEYCSRFGKKEENA